MDEFRAEERRPRVGGKETSIEEEGRIEEEGLYGKERDQR